MSPDYLIYEAVLDVVDSLDLSKTLTLDLLDPRYPELHEFASQLPTCRISDHPDPLGVDILFVSDSDSEVIPEGVKVVVYNQCEFDLSPSLPSSVVLVHYRACTELSELRDLPDSVQKVRITEYCSGDLEDKGWALSVQLPSKLLDLEINAMREVSFQSSWPQSLTSISLVNLASVRHEKLLPLSLKHVTHHAPRYQRKIGVALATLTLPMGGSLRSMSLKGTQLAANGRGIQTMKEYRAVMDMNWPWA